MSHCGRRSMLCLGVLLTALKLLLPQPAELMRERLETLVLGDGRFSEIVQAMGRGHYFTTVEAIAPEEASGRVVCAPSFAEAIERGGTIAADPESESAIQAFLLEQEKFEGYEIPEKVRTDKPRLSFEYLCPVDGIASSGFGYRQHPIYDRICFHYGSDFAAETGTPVHAFADGTVYAAGISASYGNYYVLHHSGGAVTIYAHLSEFIALEGASVKKGELIGRVGATGDATGPHLHFELMLDDRYLNPEYYV